MEQVYWLGCIVDLGVLWTWDVFVSVVRSVPELFLPSLLFKTNSKLMHEFDDGGRRCRPVMHSACRIPYLLKSSWHILRLLKGKLAKESPTSVLILWDREGFTLAYIIYIAPYPPGLPSTSSKVPRSSLNLLVLIPVRKTKLFLVLP